jgi:hypothetical protein
MTVKVRVREDKSQAVQDWLSAQIALRARLCAENPHIFHQGEEEATRSLRTEAEWVEKNYLSLDPLARVRRTLGEWVDAEDAEGIPVPPALREILTEETLEGAYGKLRALWVEGSFIPMLLWPDSVIWSDVIVIED